MIRGFVRIVLITNDNLYSLLSLERPLREFGQYLCGVYVTTNLPGQTNNLVGVWRMLRTSGLRYTGFKIFTNVVLALAARMLGVPASVTRFLQTIRVSVPVRPVANINAPDVQEEIGALKPDILLAAGCTQVIKSGVLSTARVAAVNLHPSLLPRHAGVSPYFWCFHDGDQETGATLHVMIPKLDAGPIVAQQRIPLRDGDSIMSVITQTWSANEAMITGFLRSEGGCPPIPQDSSCRSVHTHPTRREVAQFKRRGGRFLGTRDLLPVFHRLKSLSRHGALPPDRYPDPPAECSSGGTTAES